MEAECSSETLVTTYETMRCHNAADHNPYRHYHESAKPHNIVLVYIYILSVEEWVGGRDHGHAPDR
jgi:hypothetical protein